jgi:hypothetical protein
MNQLNSRSALRAALGAVAAILLGPAAAAPAQEPTTTPVPVPPGCVVTSAGLVCNTPTPFPTTTPVPTRTAVPTRTPDDEEDEGDVKNEESDSGDSSPQQVRRVPVRRLAFTGPEVWLTLGAGLTLLGGGLALRRHVQRT